MWGGEDNSTPVYGRSYISIVPTSGSITASANYFFTSSSFNCLPLIYKKDFQNRSININDEDYQITKRQALSVDKVVSLRKWCGKFNVLFCLYCPD